MAYCEKCKSSMVIIKSNSGAKRCLNCGWSTEDNSYRKIQTNADRIRAMSDLELSNFIKSVHNDGTCREYAVTHGQAFTDMFGNKGVLAWLQSEAEE